MIVNLLLIIISITISIIGIVYIITHRENFGTLKNTLLNVLLYLLLGIFFFTAINLSTEIYFNKEIALICWNFSIIIWLFSTCMLSYIHSSVIDYKKMITLRAFLYSILGGITISLLLFSNSVKVVQAENNYSFIFQNVFLLILIVLFNLIVIAQMWYIQIKTLPKFRDKKLGLMLGALAFHFSLIIFLYSIFIITQIILLKNLYLIFYLIGASIALYSNIKRPNLYIELTNRIYDFIIFHKSGILLYTYNFETNKEYDESLIKGSILLGINHILSNFFDKKKQVSCIQMQDRDIIFEYDNKLYYAILLITDKKNKFIERSLQRFMDKFRELNKENLMAINNLKKLVDVSKFKNTKELINEYFNPYIIKN